MDNKITRKLAPNVNLVAEFNDFHSFEVGTELYVYLEDDKGYCLQDLGIFRNSDIDRKNNYPRKFEDYVETLLWADENDEDYTHKFNIKVREDIEES